MRHLSKNFLVVLLTLIVLSVITPVSAGTTWYVDDSGGSNFTMVQAAIDAASAGDTIIVRDGTYSENVGVNKRLTIQSENGSSNCIVQAANSSYHVFNVTSDFVNISGFNVTGADVGHPYYSAGIHIDNDIDHCNISHNIISSNHYGVHLSNSKNNLIAYNKVPNNCFGVELDFSSKNKLVNNYVSSNDYGVYLRESDSNYIANNTYINDTLKLVPFNYATTNVASNVNKSPHQGDIIGSEGENKVIVSAHLGSHNNTITNNTFSNGGLSVYESYKNTVNNNSVNDKPIVYLEDESHHTVLDAGQVVLVNCDNIGLKNLNISKTSDGIQLLHSNYCKITESTISDNSVGVRLQYSNNSSIANNKVSENNKEGIYLLRSDNNTIIYNILSKNDLGINTGESNNNIIHSNHFSEGNNAYDYGTNNWNSTSKINYTYSGSTFTNFQGNYWGDYTGTDLDNDGIGDTPYDIPGGSNKDNYPLIESNLGVDTTPPVVIITSPKNGSAFNTPNVTILGYATDEVGIVSMSHGYSNHGVGGGGGAWGGGPLAHISTNVSFNYSIRLPSSSIPTSTVTVIPNTPVATVTSLSPTPTPTPVPVDPNRFILSVGADDAADNHGSASVVVFYYPDAELPTPSFTFDPQNPNVNESIIFNASESFDNDGNITSYEWDFDDGNRTESAGPIISHSYSIAGNYNVTLTVRDDLNLTNSKTKNISIIQTPSPTPSPTPEPSPTSPPAGGGGGGGFTPSSEIKTDSQGRVKSTYTEESSDGKAKLIIPEGTVALDAEGEPLESVSISSTQMGGTILACYLGPNGATFDPEILLSFEFDPSDVPEDETVIMKVFNGTVWVVLETTVDTTSNTATAKVSHFSLFALFTEDKATKRVSSTEEYGGDTEEESFAISQEETLPKEEIPVKEEDLARLPWWIIIAMVIVILVGLVLVLRR